MLNRTQYKSEIIEVFLYLTRMGLKNDTPANCPYNSLSQLTLDDWRLLLQISINQSVVAITLDGLTSLNLDSDKLHPKIDDEKWYTFYYEWLGRQIKVEQDYHQYVNTLTQLAAFYKHHGIKMMVLKGYGLSLLYPTPEHRPVGDIDIYLFGNQPKADCLIKQTGVDVNVEHHHHTTFSIHGINIENHYDFINVHAHQHNLEIEAELKRNCHPCIPDGNIPNIYYPNARFNTLFLLRHLGAHFAAEHMTLRQLIDWAFNPQVPLQNEYKMEEFHSVINAICNDYLGFNLPTSNPANKDIEDRVFADVLNASRDKRLTYIVRLQRWFSNRWKNRLFYQENLITTFFVQLWSHVIHPRGQAAINEQ